MYKIVKNYGFIIRYIVCAVTVESLDVTDSYILNLLVISPITSKLLWIVSFYSSKIVIYHKLGIDNSTVGSIGYTVSYILYAVALFGLLLLLNKLKIIPIITNFDIKIFYYITNYFTNIMISFTNSISENLNTI